MAKYRSIQTSFWSDAKVVDDFSPEDRYFYLYLLTNEKSNQLGCYELSIKQMCRDTGYNEETIKKLIVRFQENLKVIYYDFETKEIFIKNWYKYNWLNSENTKKCIDKEFSLIKSEFLIDLISPLYAPYQPLPSKKKKKKKNNKKNNKNKNNVSDENSSLECDFVAPTLTDILEYSQTLNFEDKEYCEKFYNHYESIGWVNGTGQEIKNWKLVFNNWLKKDKKERNATPECFKEVEKKEIDETTKQELTEMLKEFE